jgi:hypothetical protein
VQIFRSPEFDNNSLSPPVKLPKPARWDVRVADGRVLRAVNASASALQVDRSDDRGRVRLRVRFVRVTPADLLAGALAIAFGDADPGEPDAIIATSQAPLGHPSNLGRMERLDQNVACRVDASSLVWPVAPGERESPLYRYTD